jgi:hypothetical protein
LDESIDEYLGMHKRDAAAFVVSNAPAHFRWLKCVGPIANFQGKFPFRH